MLVCELGKKTLMLLHVVWEILIYTTADSTTSSSFYHAKHGDINAPHTSFSEQLWNVISCGTEACFSLWVAEQI